MMNNTSIHDLRLGLREETLKQGGIIIIIVVINIIIITTFFFLLLFLFYSCFSYLGHRASVKRFVSF
jgi:hypothetical protein